MNSLRVVYSDPMWAIGPGGTVDRDLAGLEREVFDGRAAFELGLLRDGKFVNQGPEFVEFVRGADALVIYRAKVTKDLVDALLPRCRVIARQGVGFDNLNVPLLKERGVFSFNVPDYCVEEVSTHTMSLVLALERQLCVQNDRLKGGTWDIFLGGYPRRLSQLTFGILGYGRIGRATGRKAQAFYKQVIAYDPFVERDLMNGYGVEKCASLEELLSASDVVVLHPLLDETTRHIINRDSIRHMRSTGFLVNTARGDLVEPEAVLAALEAGWIGGYGCDVFTPEDPNAHAANKRILRFDNVIVTSHRAFLSAEAEKSQRLRVAKQVMQVLETGAPPASGRLS